mmetsp:Transcript_17675/g.29616  ORF Transcript_17675/g.29616 Transcript_17675/m.29616 type:complete len:217 (+) Transcript_17675:118-768(+)|eukprot:CAMPEP_0175022018 /NCGR_PEP_ID=MMETSP0005-20121125/15056_1 /TAXON_ID=420556 /ORGANISM="Ochromonas sp., Strain CCMP1393" /LENGTH=216 /DNA_ID=CAMNT_0016280169 /DNA_START=44 /DNA_END=694 /DNA_ORIENTATION=+
MSDSRAPEFEPPLACVSRVMKSALPDNIMLTKDSRAAFVRAAGVFIFYLTHCSNDFCRESKRTTIFPQDVMAALRELGFEDFERPLEEFLEAYKKEMDQPKKAAKSKSASKSGGDGEEGAAGADGADPGEIDAEPMEDDEEEEEDEEDGVGLGLDGAMEDGEGGGEKEAESAHVAPGGGGDSTTGSSSHEVDRPVLGNDGEEDENIANDGSRMSED